MQQTLIFYPVTAMLFLTLLVWVYLYFTRLSYLLGEGVDPEKINSPTKMLAVIPEHLNWPSDNFKNLFELPVVFYVICFMIYLTETVDAIYLYLAFGFLFFRTLHSIVHCTYNRVIHRFSCYALASLCCWAMLIRLAIQFGGS